MPTIPPPISNNPQIFWQQPQEVAQAAGRVLNDARIALEGLRDMRDINRELIIELERALAEELNPHNQAAPVHGQ